MQFNKTIRLVVAGLAVAFTSAASLAGDHAYVGGRATTCTSTCDSFASLTALPEGSTLAGTVTIDAGVSDTWTAADVTDFAFVATSPSAPLEAYDGTNPTTANPLPVDTSVAVVEASNTAGTVTTGGTTDADGNIDSGTILFRFTVAPFNNNDAWVIFDVGTGSAQVCLFFDTSGCIAMATESVVFETQGFSLDTGGVHDYRGGEAFVCTGTCDSFAALGGPGGAVNATPSTMTGSLTVNAGASSTFGSTDITGFSFEVFNSAEPVVAYDGTNPDVANPLPVDSSVAVVEASNTAGTVLTGGNTDANGEISEGTVLFRFTVAPFNNNDAWVVFDVGRGTAQVCLFYDTSGCIPMATEAVVLQVAPPFSLIPDSDGDGVNDANDNCTFLANPTQLDADGDGHGNRCDADLNQNCIVNALDLGIFKTRFFTPDPVADFDGSGIVNALDLGILKSLFFGVPGESAPGALCN